MKRILSGLLLSVLSIILVAGCSTSASDPVKSSNVALSALTLSTGTLTPVFSAETTVYTVNVPSATTAITVTGTTSDANATLSANNGVPQALNVGVNTITLTVKAQDGTTTKDYVVTVTRAGNSNADLSALVVSTGTLSSSFVAGTTAYTVNVPFAMTAITVTGTTSDANATLSANNGVSQPLNVGVNTITLTVTAQDGATTKDYVVTVTRAGNSNADLSALVVSTGTLSSSFVAGTTAYTVNVPFATTAITVTGTASDANATLSANNGVPQSLNVGDNVITISITVQDGTTTKDYVVTVNRLSFGLTMISVPAGIFQRDQNPANTSTVSAFRMSACEITRAQFLAIMGIDPSDASCSSGLTDPVQRVNWYHAIAFCNKLSIAEGLSRVYDVVGFDNDAAWTALSYTAIPTVDDAKWNAVNATGTKTGYRLPTDIEWMWAAMGATSDRSNGNTGSGINTTGYEKTYAGSTEAGARLNIGNYAWYSSNSSNKTHPVGTAGTTGHPNELGLYDMSGNVWEWNWDLLQASGTARVECGGSFCNDASVCRVACRSGTTQYNQYRDVGFRVVRP